MEAEAHSSSLERFARGFIPAQTGKDADALTRRARLLLVVLGLCAGNLVFTALVHVGLGNLAFAATMLSIVLVALAFAAGLRIGLPIHLLTHGTVGAIYLVSTGVALATAGRVAGGLFFLVLVPAMAILLIDRRAGIYWAGTTLATLFALGCFLGTTEFTPVVELSESAARDANLRSAGLVALAVSAMAYFYSSLNQKSNDALRESVAQYQQGERRFRAMTEYAYDLIAELDGEGRFIFASPRFEESLGLRPEKIVGRTLRERVHPEDRARAAEYWTELLEKGLVRQESLRIQAVPGGYRWFEVTMRAYTSVHGEARVVAVARDATERLQREKLLRHQQNLVAGGAMAAGAAHQLNNPVGAILAAAQYANQFKWNPRFGDLAGDSLDAIEEEARRCGQIIRSMLSFARQEPAERWTEDVKQVLRRAMRVVELEERDSDSEIVLSLGDDPAPVLMSPIEIEQALSNVIRNAIEARAGVIVLGLRVVGESTVEITISDDGSGLGALSEEQIFDPFFTTQPDSRSGLGLTVAREIIESHSGRLYLKKADADGSVFRIELPLAQTEVVLLRPHS